MLPSLSWSRNWHNKEDSETLSDYASKCDGLSFIEIGSAEGQSAITMLLASENTFIQMIEPFVTTNLLNNIKAMKLGNRVVIYPTTSREGKITPAEVGILFIDAVHTYEEVSFDLEKWSGSDAKYIILHDTSLPELWKAVEEFIAKGKYQLEETLENITVLSKI
jgi:hypothetical protein